MECPVDLIPINENKARLIAFFVLIITIVFLLTGCGLAIAFLFVDFASRAFNLGKYSLLAFLSDAVIKQLKIKNKPVDRGPKRFAAGVGMVFTAAILVLLYANYINIANTVAIVLGFFALLESFFAFCAGCYVYYFGKRLNLFK